MSSDAEQHGGGGQTEDPEAGGCQPCDLGDVEGIACKAKRYAKQAEVMTQVATDLDGYKKQYHEARKAFGDAWDATAEEIKAVRKQLDDLHKVLKCRLTDPHQKECLDKAAEKEFEVIDACAPPAGCCVGNCDFDDMVGEDDDATSLGARIDAYRRDTTANVACFLSLIVEAKARADQVAKIKAEVTSLATDSAANDDTKLPSWYARWLIADHQLQLSRLGHGFTMAGAYGDCLCKVLQCIAKGWDAIAVLEGARAEVVCLEAATKTECERRTASVLVTILDAYECCMDGAEPEPPCQDRETEPEQTGVGSWTGSVWHRNQASMTESHWCEVEVTRDLLLHRRAPACRGKRLPLPLGRPVIGCKWAGPRMASAHRFALAGECSVEMLASAFVSTVDSTNLAISVVERTGSNFIRTGLVPSVPAWELRICGSADLRICGQGRRP